MTTNYEKIKAMSIDEMAEILSLIALNPCKLCDAPDCRTGYECINGWRLWLNQEAE